MGRFDSAGRKVFFIVVLAAGVGHDSWAEELCHSGVLIGWVRAVLGER